MPEMYGLILIFIEYLIFAGTLSFAQGRPLHRSMDAACVLEKTRGGEKIMHIVEELGENIISSSARIEKVEERQNTTEVSLNSANEKSVKMEIEFEKMGEAGFRD